VLSPHRQGTVQLLPKMVLRRLRTSRRVWSGLRHVEVQKFPLPSPSDHRIDRVFLLRRPAPAAAFGAPIRLAAWAGNGSATRPVPDLTGFAAVLLQSVMKTFTFRE
jgi:hypothetical protein